jgi:hypothetical protein
MSPALMDHTPCHGLWLLSCERLAIPAAAAAAGLLLNVHKQPTRWKSHLACSVISPVTPRGGNATPLPAPLPEPGSAMIW